MLRSPLMAKAAATAATGGTGDLGLKGAGVERVVIPGLDEALKDYKTKRDVRMAASREEVKAKDACLVLIKANAEKLVDAKGIPHYKVEIEGQETDVYLQAKKETIKFGKGDTAADEEPQA